jgi:hypothetical protein
MTNPRPAADAETISEEQPTEGEDKNARRMATRQVFRLLPCHHVDVFDPSGVVGVRFARWFREAWRRLPLGVRRRILKHCGGRAPLTPR